MENVVKHSTKGKQTDSENILIAAQVPVEKSDLSRRPKMLTSLKTENKFKVRILSSLVTLFLALDDREAAATLLIVVVVFNAKKEDRLEENCQISFARRRAVGLLPVQPQEGPGLGQEVARPQDGPEPIE